MCIRDSPLPVGSGSGEARGSFMSKTRAMRIVHFSDIHCGSQYFVPNLLDRTLVEINDLAPEMVVLTGDLTNMGYRQEFREAREYLDRLECRDVIVVPGNHDSRNVGYMHFERLFSSRDSAISKGCLLYTSPSPRDRT